MQILSFKALLALPSLGWLKLEASSLYLMEQICRLGLVRSHCMPLTALSD
jgi:hypothetical protein